MPIALAALDLPARAVTSEPDDDAALVTAARHGDSDAFGRLVRRHERRVFRLAGRFHRKRHDVEDAAQETFLRAWTKLATYRAEAPFEHWLTRLCLNVCIERCRRRRVSEIELPADLVASATDPAAALDAARALAELDAADRYVLVALDIEGDSTAEIAARLGWSRANVKVRAFRARRRLRRFLTAVRPERPSRGET